MTDQQSGARPEHPYSVDDVHSPPGRVTCPAPSGGELPDGHPSQRDRDDEGRAAAAQAEEVELSERDSADDDHGRGLGGNCERVTGRDRRRQRRPHQQHDAAGRRQPHRGDDPPLPSPQQLASETSGHGQRRQPDRASQQTEHGRRGGDRAVAVQLMGRRQPMHDAPCRQGGEGAAKHRELTESSAPGDSKNPTGKQQAGGRARRHQPELRAVRRHEAQPVTMGYLSGRPRERWIARTD